MANFISILRILLSIVLLFLRCDNIAFWIIYSVCGITDVLDGFVARITKTESSLGGKLDSIGDLFFGIVIIKILYPIVMVNTFCLIWIFVIAIIRIISVLIVFSKYHKFAILHTCFNKLTGLSIFLCAYFVAFLSNITYIVCFIAMIASIEELYINFKSTELDVNVNY